MQELLFNPIEEKELWFNKEKCKYFIVDTEAKLRRLAELMLPKKIIAFDIETNGLRIDKSIVVGTSICIEEGFGFYIPFKHYKSKCITHEMYTSYLKDILETKPILGHNLKFDFKFMKEKLDIELNCKHDTFVIAKLLDEFDFAGLKYLGEVLFGYEVSELDVICKNFGISYDQLDLLKTEELADYACQDVDLTLRLFKYFWTEMEWRPDFIYDLEIDLIKSLAFMEMRGMQLDVDLLTNLKKEYNEKTEIIGDKIKESLDLPSKFNIDSNIQLGNAIVEKYPSFKSKLSFTEKSGAVALNESYVKKYQYRMSKFFEEEGITDQSNVFELHRERKKYFNLLTKYIEPWVDNVNKLGSDILYVDLKALGAATGRMTCSKPNLLAVAPEMRKAVVPRDGYYFMSMDFDQVEYRIFAAMAGLTHLIDEINKNNADVHTLATMLLYDIPEEEVTPELRKMCKTINFGVLYGMGIPKLAESLGITIEEAEELKARYNERFLRNTKWFADIKRFAREHGYILTEFGRKRRIDNLNLQYDKFGDYDEQKEIRRLLGDAYRKAINSPIQGTSADVTKIGVNNISKKIRKDGLDIHPLLVIHDEVVLEVNKKYSPEFVFNELKTAMEMKFKDLVYLTVDHNVSEKSWGHLKDG